MPSESDKPRHPAHWQSRIGQFSEMLVNGQMLEAHRQIAKQRNPVYRGREL